MNSVIEKRHQNPVMDCREGFKGASVEMGSGKSEEIEMEWDHLRSEVKWPLLFFGFALMGSWAHAATSNCRNPMEISLDPAHASVKMSFCEIPSGSAWIGSERGDSDERPMKKRDFKGFQMGQYTVTQAQYRAVLGEEFEFEEEDERGE
ncbi:MAG: SUMF1/EgtB/PvdO family nonheme iron enzyme, partial [Bdellovibrionia bacterium]